MHVNQKVGITLQSIGLALLISSAIFKLPIFWPVFGMGCMIAGTYKLICRLIEKRSQIAGD